MSKKTNCFILHSEEDEALTNRIIRLKEKLNDHSIDVILDELHGKQPGQINKEFIHKNLRDADTLLVLCTPKYKKKIEKKEGLVYYEFSKYTDEFFSYLFPYKKIIPLIFQGDFNESVPNHKKLTGAHCYNCTRTTKKRITTIAEAIKNIPPTEEAATGTERDDYSPDKGIQ